MKTFEWEGPMMAPEYVSKGYFRLANERVKLLAEEMLYAWVSLPEKYSQDKTYQKNFYSDLKFELTDNQKKLKFPKDFEAVLISLKDAYELEKIHKTEYKSTHKEEEKARIQYNKEHYGTCKIDGNETSIMYVVESPSIFRGRGDNPMSGHWKYRVEQKDIELNFKPGKGPRGYWKKVEWKPDVAFGGCYIQNIGHGGLFKTYKTFLFGNSKVNTERSVHKFEMARKVIENWDKLEKAIFEGIHSENEVEKQTAMVLYLVLKLGIRIGNEKDLDVMADTVGASTLRKENIKVVDDTLILDFIGKDSIKDHRELELDKFTSQEFRKVIDNSADKVFDRTNSALTEEFLRKIVPGCTNKMIRSAYGCGLLAYHIQQKNWDNLTDKQFKLQYDKCNMEVAIQLNHRSTIDKEAKKLQDSKNKERIKKAKQQLEQNKLRWASQIENINSQIAKAKTSDKKIELREKKRAIKQRELKAIQSFMDLKESLNFRIGIGDIALGTSKANYSTPELAFSLCNYTGKDPKLIYTSALLKKFEWAKDSKKTLWKEYPTIVK